MRNILIIGAGRSATSLIRYLLDKSDAEDLFITIGDISIQSAQKFTSNHPNARGIWKTYGHGLIRKQRNAGA